MMITTTFTVSGMTCQHCKMAVERALQELKGVTQIEVKLESGQVTVTYDQNSVQAQQIVETITEAGYSVQK